MVRRLYNPVQPSNWRTNDVVYSEYLPSQKLGDFIYCYWELKSKFPLSESFKYRVVADGCMDIFFQPGKPSEAFVMGVSDSYTRFPIGKNFRYFGIRFFPSMFPQLFRIYASELSGKAESLESVIPELDKYLSSRITAEVSTASIISLLNIYFETLCEKQNFDFDPRFYLALERQLSSPSTQRIEKDTEGISVRQLRRLYGRFIGTNLKTFGRIVRFQQILQNDPQLSKIRKDKHYFDAGYFDQAHFIREFSEFYGTTPGKTEED